MVELKNKSVAETFNAKLKTPWVWLVIVLTVGLTALFYFSQKPQIVIYSQYIKSLSEYQLLESDLMRSMEHVRTGYDADTLLVQSQTMTLREMAVSFSKDMDELRLKGAAVPPDFAVARFERNVLGKVAGVRRYAATRRNWIKQWEKISMDVANLPAQASIPLHEILDSARVGMAVARPNNIDVPDSLAIALDALFNDNNEQSIAWSRFDNSVVLMNTVDLMQFFQSEILNDLSLKSKIPMVFYFLSLVLLLSTFFFLFKSRL